MISSLLNPTYSRLSLPYTPPPPILFILFSDRVFEDFSGALHLCLSGASGGECGDGRDLLKLEGNGWERRGGLITTVSCLACSYHLFIPVWIRILRYVKARFPLSAEKKRI